jgi:hypothetical protein
MITININKAKAVAHNNRRAMREQEFAPHDAVIAKQIPNKTAEAEAARAAIRDKYAQMQTAIDLAGSLEEIKAALR